MLVVFITPKELSSTTSGKKPARGVRSPQPVVFAELRQAFTKIPVTVWSNPFQLSLPSSDQST